ncbi:MAG: glycosyltransferase family 4 protein [Pseudomonadota bacterium]
MPNEHPPPSRVEQRTVSPLSRSRLVHVFSDAPSGAVARIVEGLMNNRLLARFDQYPQVTSDPADWRSATATADVAVIHLSMGWRYLPALLKLRWTRPRLRIVLVEHTYCAGYESHKVRHRVRFRSMLRLAYAMAHQVVTVSRAQRAWMLDARLVSPSKLVLIPPYLEHPVLRRLPPPGVVSPLRLGALGHLGKRNGFDQLLQAVRLLPHEHLEVVIGGDGPDAESLRQQASDLPRVHFTGPVADASAFLSAVDVLVVPSRYDAFGAVVAAARAAGRPVLVANADGLPEQVSPDTGWVLEDDSVGALTAALRRLPRSAAIGRMGAAARRSAEKGFRESTQRWSALLWSLAPPAGR